MLLLVRRDANAGIAHLQEDLILLLPYAHWTHAARQVSLARSASTWKSSTTDCARSLKGTGRGCGRLASVSRMSLMSSTSALTMRTRRTMTDTA